MSGIIDSNPEILDGKPIITGTRIPVDLIFELLGLNYPLDYIIDQYLSLTKEILIKIIQIAQDAQKNLQAVNWQKILS